MTWREETIRQYAKLIEDLKTDRRLLELITLQAEEGSAADTLKSRNSALIEQYNQMIVALERAFTDVSNGTI